jgi:hypothetical protein
MIISNAPAGTQLFLGSQWWGDEMPLQPVLSCGSLLYSRTALLEYIIPWSQIAAWSCVTWQRASRHVHLSVNWNFSFLFDVDSDQIL